MPTVSVVIATHNRPRSLVRAVESARSASRERVEVVVVDDASADETAEVCAALDGITYVRVERNQGVAGARNVGILASTGEYLTFLDDDDVRLPGSLDRQLAKLDAFPEAGLVYGQAVVSGGGPERSYPAVCPRGDVFWDLLAQNFVPCGSAVFRRTCLFRVGMLDESIAGVDDWDLWVRIAECHTVTAVPEPVLVWRASTPMSGQGTSRAAEIVAAGTSRFRRHWMVLPRAASARPSERHRSWRRFSGGMARHLLWQAGVAATAGRPGIAARNVAAVLRLHPAAAARVAREVPRHWSRLAMGQHR